MADIPREMLAAQKETNRLLAENQRFLESIDTFGIPMLAIVVGVGVWLTAGIVLFK